MSIKTVNIQFDQETENPCNYDGWKIYSFNRKDQSYKKFIEKYSREQQIFLKTKLAEGLAFTLDRYEHSGIIWNLSGEGQQCPWDTAIKAGVIIWENPAHHLGPTSIIGRAEDARLFIKTYNDWINGYCYYYNIDTENGEIIDSCGGIIGETHLIEMLNETLTDDDEIILKGEACECVPTYKLKSSILEGVLIS